MNIAKIVVDLSLDKPFDYRIPDALRGRIHIGAQVMVPFGHSTRHGYVLDIVAISDCRHPLKDIHSVCGHHGHIPEPLIKLGRWMADYYCCSREQAVRTLLPRAVRGGKIKHKTLKWFAVADVPAAEKFIIEHGDDRRMSGQLAVLKVLLSHQEVTLEQLLSESGTGESPVNALVRKELVSVEQRIVRRDPFVDIEIVADKPLPPTPEQAGALRQIEQMLAEPSGRNHVMLLYGITNSGKTEVYLQSIAVALARGKEAIVLVPEISLTPQTVRHFRARFGDLVSVMHSRLTEGERFDEWSKINDGLVKIVVGARSALFAPFRNLGLIIVDEEHENSYKQGESPRYHARDVAVVRGKMEKAVVILGSATPSFESYNNALNGKYELAELRQRVDNCVLPTVRVVDCRLGAPEPGKSSFFSKILIDAVHARLRAGEQTILFLNRRGYARQMMCEHCGYVAVCPDCSVSYTYHRQRETLSCHWCGNVVSAYTACPSCGMKDIRYTGVGTEKIEAAAMKVFSGGRIVRMDSDTMRKTSSYEDTLGKFKRGEIDILIGTQMIAKGLHFPNVTLVGVINADQGLMIPDFRACERTFQLLTQVAGRAGRGDVKGEVIVQTYNPDNDTIRHAVRQDFKGFYKYDMELREQLCYPPNGRLIAVHVRSPDLGKCRDYAETLMSLLRPYCHDRIIVTEPAPAPIERVKGKYRYLTIFRGTGMTRLRQMLRRLLLHERIPKEVEAYADVDAQSLL